MIRDDIKAAQVAAMKAGDKARLGTIRLMLAKIKDKDIELRTGTAPADDNVLVTDVLQKMVKQRRESIAMYEQGGRQELADIEAGETPAQRLKRFKTLTANHPDHEETRLLMAELKARHSTVLDMGLASALVKTSFG